MIEDPAALPLLLSLLLLLVTAAAGNADVVLALHACGAASDWSLLQAKQWGAAFIISPCCIGKIKWNNTAGIIHGKHKRFRTESSPGHSNTRMMSDVAEDEVPAGVWEEHSTREPALHVLLQQQTSLLQYPRSQWMTQQIDQLAEQVLHNQQHKQQEGDRTSEAHQVLTPLQQAVLRAGVQQGRCQEVFKLLAQAADYSHQEQHGYPALAALAKSNVEFDRGRGMSEQGYAVQLVRLLQPELTAKSDVLVGMPHCGLGTTDVRGHSDCSNQPKVDVQTVDVGYDGCSRVVPEQRFSWVW